MLTFELSSLTCDKYLFLASHLFWTLQNKSRGKPEGDHGYFFACVVLSHPHPNIFIRKIMKKCQPHSITSILVFFYFEMATRGTPFSQTSSGVTSKQELNSRMGRKNKENQPTPPIAPTPTLLFLSPTHVLFHFSFLDWRCRLIPQIKVFQLSSEAHHEINLVSHDQKLKKKKRIVQKTSKCIIQSKDKHCLTTDSFQLCVVMLGQKAKCFSSSELRSNHSEIP